MATIPAPSHDDGSDGSAALAAIYDAHAPRLFAVARRILREPADAEECVQEIFVRLVERGVDLDAVGDLSAYLFTSLHHAAATRFKQSERRLALHQRAAPIEEPQTASVDLLQTRALERALQTLPLEQREVVSLKVDGELTFAEIAQVLGVGLNTAASRYRYALAKLKSALEENEP